MKKITAAIFSIALALLYAGAALAQSSPGLAFGDVPTAAQWNSYFSAKQDYLGFTPINPSSLAGTSPINVVSAAGVITISCPTCFTTGSGFANPSATVGLTATNGVATTAMRSDASPALAKGVNANVLNTQTSNYTIQASDCGKTIQLGTGTTGYFTLTVPSVSGFDGTCSVVATNGDSVRLKSIAGYSGITKLFPTQSINFRIINGAWWAPAPARQKLSARVDYYYNPATGSSSNDGTIAGSPVADPNTIIGYLQSYIDTGGQIVGINAGNTATPFAGDVFVAGPFVGDVCNVFLIGAGAGSSFINSTSGAAAINVVNPGACLNVQNISLGSSNSLSQLIEASNNAMVRFAAIDVGKAHVHFYADTGGRILADGNWSMSDSPTESSIHCSHGGGFRALDKTYTLTANIVTTYFMKAYAGGDCTFQTNTPSFGGHTITGTRYYSSTGANIFTAGADPTPWGTVEGIVTAGGGFDELYPQVGKQVFTASGTYTPRPGMTSAILECVGGGGAGGGVVGASSFLLQGGGGGSGGYSRKYVTAANIGASKAVTIGAGGTGSSGNNGGAGGDSSIGVLIVAKGGGGGDVATSAANPVGGTGAIAGTGDLTATGHPGLPGNYFTPVAGVTFLLATGGGGSSMWGGGAKAVAPNLNGAGNAGALYGGAGSGGGVTNSATNVAGGAGAAGVCIVTEYN